jgi:dihydropyrimidinase
MYSFGVAAGRISENQFVASLAENTARLFGLYPQKGKIAEGSDGDIVVWDPNAEVTIAAATQLQNVDYTPYEGLKVQGRPKAVFLRGQLAAENGKVLITNAGQYLPRHSCNYFRRKTE